ncbi:TPA: hypothetical protein NH603_005986 [Pseudomonas aeruginosa]|uniref:hypothetical protein n=1 Tax=Gammaproteobacteria TaxID=1236 RepID=UPI001BCB08CB|nr:MULTISPECIES: hypothetical protein [Gammaproteobacteria]MBW6121803.1 hypothetical protein [Pseudomonas aeruginosa]HBO8103716.1 hypothetical protein [Pseudomonas aeruginosa]HBO8663099.1 hypothetical protein [Pseudomonas aeruginosa]HCF0112723.1 hypothetical protein [Pseudomonas aeruginosa]HCK4505725.1 hypothetical protein [Pseudomonas aeruginosa]
MPGAVEFGILCVFGQVLGRVLRRIGEPDDQAWLFMLAEPTLRSFAERIADDLPDDLAVLSQVQMPAAPAGSMAGGMEGVSDVDGSCDSEGGQGVGAGSRGAYSLIDVAAEPSYQVSFSQHYRQLLLACL